MGEKKNLVIRLFLWLKQASVCLYNISKDTKKKFRSDVFLIIFF